MSSSENLKWKGKVYETKGVPNKVIDESKYELSNKKEGQELEKRWRVKQALKRWSR